MQWWLQLGEDAGNVCQVELACVAGARKEEGKGIRSKREKRAWSARGGGTPAASLLLSPLRPLINMQMQDICKTSGCQITSNENLA